MLVALHIDPKDWSRLLGVWQAPDGSEGFPKSYYPEPAEGFDIAKGRMETKGLKVPWPAFFWRLEKTTPYSAYWSTHEVDDAPLPEVFAVLRARVQSSAEALGAGQPSGGISLVVPGVTASPFDLARLAGGPVEPFEVKGRLSTLCSFFADDDRLLVVARPHVDQSGADLALAWGLAYRGDRQLSVLLPEALAGPSLLRAPWFAPPVRVLTYAKDHVAEPSPLTQSESIDHYRHWVEEAPAELDEKSAWVQPLLEWLRTVPGIDAVARNSYVAWHVHGRQVLKITPGKTRLTIVAGVDAQSEFHGKEPLKVTLNGPAPDHLILKLIAATALAAADRLEGVDNTHREHRLQSHLRPAQLGLRSWKREFPAWRPGSDRSAFIDFLGVDDCGRINVVETKIGPDTMLVFQGLDYWLWSRANMAKIGTALHTSNSGAPTINFVVAPKEAGGQLISPYTAAQAEALHRTIRWQFVTMNDADTAKGLEVLAPFQLPPGAKRAGETPARWAVRLHQHAVSEATTVGIQLKHGHNYPNDDAALLPAALEAQQHLAAQGLVHDYIGHVRSSQAFALNMLAPLSNDAWTAIAQHIIGHEHCEVLEPAVFEYVDPADELGESTHASPHVTQVDCLVRVQLRGGGQHLLFIEVKLCEDSFSSCSAYASPQNPRKHICDAPLPFGGDPDGCFQLANHDREHRRRYDTALDLPTATPAGFGCWFRDGGNQVMRNTALARQLIRRGEAVSASFLLLAPDSHTTIWQQWHEHTARLAGVNLLQFRSLPASMVAALHEPATARLLCRRYMLPLDVLNISLAQRVVDERFPNGVLMTRLNSDGTERYTQRIERLPVVSATEDAFSFWTPYPAGPFVHRTHHADWTDTTGDVTIPDPEDGSRVFSAELSALTDGEQRELHDLAANLQRRRPWWTAPIADALPTYW
ncbi:MAG: hypothetical protein H6513_19515 [Acidimicrobiaceae bacterium]|nr:hypothetical protein [Acidimicrobiaceae bacterium]